MGLRRGNADETYRLCACAPDRGLTDLVCDQSADRGSTRTISQPRDVQENIRATATGHDKAKASFVIPFSDATLISHGESEV